jgi:hypothetical protein
MSALHVAVTTVTFPPIAVGFFGLATGYLVYGAQELLGYPRRPNEKVDLATGIWGVWMPGFMQFITASICSSASPGSVPSRAARRSIRPPSPLPPRGCGRDLHRPDRGLRLLYLTWAAALNFAAGYQLPL